MLARVPAAHHIKKAYDGIDNVVYQGDTRTQVGWLILGFDVPPTAKVLRRRNFGL